MNTFAANLFDCFLAVNAAEVAQHLSRDSARKAADRQAESLLQVEPAGSCKRSNDQPDTGQLMHKLVRPMQSPISSAVRSCMTATRDAGLGEVDAIVDGEFHY